MIASAPDRATGPSRPATRPAETAASGEREVPKTVAHEGEPLLHEERAIRGPHAPTTRPDAGALHVVVVERPRERQAISAAPRRGRRTKASSQSGRSSACTRGSRRGGPGRRADRRRPPGAGARRPVEVGGTRRSWTRAARRPLLGARGDERFAEEPLRLGVDPGDGLVEHEQLRVAGQGPGDQDPLLLAARELFDRAPPQVGERHGPQCVVDGGAVGRAGAPPPSPARETAGGHHLLYGDGHVAAGADRWGTYRRATAPTCGVGPPRTAAPNGRRSQEPSTIRSSVDLPERSATTARDELPAPTARSTPVEDRLAAVVNDTRRR